MKNKAVKATSPNGKARSVSPASRKRKKSTDTKPPKEKKIAGRKKADKVLKANLPKKSIRRTDDKQNVAKARNVSPKRSAGKAKKTPRKPLSSRKPRSPRKPKVSKISEPIVTMPSDDEDTKCEMNHSYPSYDSQPISNGTVVHNGDNSSTIHERVADSFSKTVSYDGKKKSATAVRKAVKIVRGRNGITKAAETTMSRVTHVKEREPSPPISPSRPHRVASLNAMAKVHFMYEQDHTKPSTSTSLVPYSPPTIQSIGSDSDSDDTIEDVCEAVQFTTSKSKATKKRFSAATTTVPPVEKKPKRKTRETVCTDLEIFAPRSRRMASLNAQAIMNVTMGYSDRKRHRSTSSTKTERPSSQATIVEEEQTVIVETTTTKTTTFRKKIQSTTKTEKSSTQSSRRRNSAQPVEPTSGSAKKLQHVSQIREEVTKVHINDGNVRDNSQEVTRTYVFRTQATTSGDGVNQIPTPTLLGPSRPVAALPPPPSMMFPQPQSVLAPPPPQPQAPSYFTYAPVPTPQFAPAPQQPQMTTYSLPGGMMVSVTPLHRHHLGSAFTVPQTYTTHSVYSQPAEYVSPPGGFFQPTTAPIITSPVIHQQQQPPQQQHSMDLSRTSQQQQPPVSQQSAQCLIHKPVPFHPQPSPPTQAPAPIFVGQPHSPRQGLGDCQQQQPPTIYRTIAPSRFVRPPLTVQVPMPSSSPSTSSVPPTFSPGGSTSMMQSTRPNILRTPGVIRVEVPVSARPKLEPSLIGARPTVSMATPRGQQQRVVGRNAVMTSSGPTAVVRRGMGGTSGGKAIANAEQQRKTKKLTPPPGRRRHGAVSPTPLPPLPRKGALKRKFPHGWGWEGDPFYKRVATANEESGQTRVCYPAMRHAEGDVIRPRDCVLLKSGPRELPFVAKVAALWENDAGEMMMSLLWYYRPEHTGGNAQLVPAADDPGVSQHLHKAHEDELFASRHRDSNPVATVEDKCYVMTYAEYCRYRARVKRLEEGRPFSRMPPIVPPLPIAPSRRSRLPPSRVSADLVFFCRKVYDFRQRRVLKNPIISNGGAANGTPSMNGSSRSGCSSAASASEMSLASLYK